MHTSLSLSLSIYLYIYIYMINQSINYCIMSLLLIHDIDIIDIRRPYRHLRLGQGPIIV